MEIPKIEDQKSLKKNYWKFVKRFFLIIIGIVSLYAFGLWGWIVYDQWDKKTTAQIEYQKIQIMLDEANRNVAADTYGGKTPQETLQMYIDAVEKGNFELASKYFILPNQKKELESFEKNKKENINFLLNYLKQTIKSTGYFSSDKKIYTFEKPIFIEFEIYPKGIWKIMEI
ncbi:DUF4878 domain-containing protein [Candidatus Wolfebacteria bacterium]|nr:DUF4878 domain-containing protein [Candidatus Wolfebacteria bacterium]